MPLTLTVATAPTVEPLLLDEVKKYLRVDGTDDDAVIEALMLAAREEVETWTGRTLLSTTYALRLDGFPACDVFALPRPPLQSVTSITYVDADGVSQTLATTVYGSDVYSEPGRIYLKSGQAWPSTSVDAVNTVIITYVAGWTLATIPERAKLAMKLMIGDTYENREGQDVGRVFHLNDTLKRLLWGLRLLEAA